MKFPRVAASGSTVIQLQPKPLGAEDRVFRNAISLRPRDAFTLRRNDVPSTSPVTTSTIVYPPFAWSAPPVSAGPGRVVLNELHNALLRLGLPLDAPAVKAFLSLETAVPDSVVEALRRKVMTDASLAGPVAEALRHYSAEALAKGTKTPADKLLRLELLALAVPDEVRPALLEAVRMELDHQSDAIKQFLKTEGQGLDARGRPQAFVPLVTIGGGPQGQTIANRLHEEGKGKGNLVVDATRAGEGNFGSVRSHPANSRTREGYQGDTPEVMLQTSRTQHPLHGSPVQVEDLNAAAVPQAGDIGDAASLGLYAAFTRGTEVLTESRVKSIEEVEGRNGKFLVRIVDVSGGEFGVLTNQVVLATGMGKPNLPLTHPETRAYVEARSLELTTRGGAALPTQPLAHSEDFLRASNTATDEELLDFVRKGEGPLMVVGFGDAAKTPLLRLKEVAERNGTTLEALLGRRRIQWLGVKDEAQLTEGLRGVYRPLRSLVEARLVDVIDGRLEQIAPLPGKLEHRVTIKRPDGIREERPTGRLVLAMGMSAELPEFIALKPRDGHSYTFVYGKDPVYGDTSPLAKQLTVGGHAHDVFAVGAAAGLERPKDGSFLDFHGWKNVLLTSQVLAPKIVHNANPFTILRTDGDARGPLDGTPSSRATVSLSPVGVRTLLTPDAELTVETGLFGVLSRFEFVGRESLKLTFTGAPLTLETVGLDEAAAATLARTLEEHPALVGLIDRLATAKPFDVSVRLVDGKVAEVS